MVLNALLSVLYVEASSQVQQIIQPIVCQKCKMGKATWGITGISHEWIMLLCTVCRQQSNSHTLRKLSGRCIKCTRCAIFGLYKPIHCKAHRDAGDTDLIHAKCSFPGCIRTQPTWGEAHKEARYCRQHRLPNHMFLTKRTCKQAGCLKSPSYGLAGERTCNRPAPRATRRPS
jgi:hypothetical protein